MANECLEPFLTKTYPELCSKNRVNTNGHSEFGGVALPDFFHLAKELGLATKFEIGFGQAFIEANKSRLADGIFLQTTNHPDGTHGEYHFWRLENTHPDYFLVVEPFKYEPMKHLWDSLEKRECVVIVCIP